MGMCVSSVVFLLAFSHTPTVRPLISIRTHRRRYVRVSEALICINYNEKRRGATVCIQLS